MVPGGAGGRRSGEHARDGGNRRGTAPVSETHEGVSSRSGGTAVTSGSIRNVVDGPGNSTRETSSDVNLTLVFEDGTYKIAAES